MRCSGSEWVDTISLINSEWNYAIRLLSRSPHIVPCRVSTTHFASMDTLQVNSRNKQLAGCKKFCYNCQIASCTFYGGSIAVVVAILHQHYMEHLYIADQNPLLFNRLFYWKINTSHLHMNKNYTSSQNYISFHDFTMSVFWSVSVYSVCRLQVRVN